MTQRLIKIRSYLIEIAKNNDTVFYSELSELLNLGYDFSNDSKAGILFGNELSDISRYEINKGRPLLTVVVINKYKDKIYNEHLPSQKFYTTTKRFKQYKTDFNTKTKLQIFNEQSKILFDFWNDPQNYENHKDFK
jgi:hypothetical protein